MQGVVWCVFSIHTHPFYGPFSWTTQVSRYQKGKTNLDFTEARDSEWQWHQLAHIKSAPRSRQITTPAPHHSVFTGRMPFLSANQQRQSTEGNIFSIHLTTNLLRNLPLRICLNLFRFQIIMLMGTCMYYASDRKT